MANALPGEEAENTGPTIMELRRLADVEPDELKRAAIEAQLIEKANRLVLRWHGFALAFAKRYFQYFFASRENDVRQAALVGMIEASRKFDETLGSFSTIAAWYMRKEIQYLYLTDGKDISSKRNPKYSARLITEEFEKMRLEGVREDFEVACDRIGIPHTFRKTLKKNWDLTVAEFMEITPSNEPSTQGSNPVFDDVTSHENLRLFDEAMSMLPEWGRIVITDAMNGVYQKHTADTLGVTIQTMIKYRDIAVDWIRFWVGEGERPEQGLPTYLKQKSRTAVPKGKHKLAEHDPSSSED